MIRTLVGLAAIGVGLAPFVIAVLLDNILPLLVYLLVPLSFAWMLGDIIVEEFGNWRRR